MNANNPGQRFRGPSNASQPGPSPRQGYDVRNGLASPGFSSGASVNGGGSQAGNAQLSRAEKFEEEKKRIIESCFSKKDSDGSIQESYITHIQVTEDANYPSSPPPTESSSGNKPRVVMVAVRKSGRVRMHKGRQNANSSYSIGKTWPLDDLSRIESFTNAVATTPEQIQNKQRAGDGGFVVTIGKPYYWRANTAKEKDFFILSLIKIYRKYTGGKLPELVGFSAHEIGQLGGPASQVQNAGKSDTNGTPALEMPARHGDHDARRPDVEPGRGHRSQPSEDRTSHERSAMSPSSQSQDHRVLHSASASRDRNVRNKSSSDNIRPPGAFPSTDSVQSQYVQSSFQSKRSQSPGSTTSRTYSNSSRAQSRNRQYAPSQPDTEPSIPPPPTGRSSSEHPRANGVYPGQGRFRAASQARSEASDDRPRTAGKDDPMPPALAIRSPKKNPLPSLSSDRPQLDTGSNNSSRFPSRDNRADDTRTDSREGRRSDRDMRNDTSPIKTRAASAKPSNQGTAWSTAANEEPKLPASTINGPDTTATSLGSEPPADSPTDANKDAGADFRPGLGPMIKKKTQGEIASKFRKAAIAYNAFKPRAGSAAEKKADESKESGDGITGVFQAPSLLRGQSQDDAKPDIITKDSLRPSTPDSRSIPSLSVASSPSKTGSLQAQEQRNLSLDERKASLTGSKPPIPPQDERRKKRRSDHSAKYAKSLGIKHGLLEGRTYEIDALLNDLGWVNESSKTTYDDIETGIRKELARIEAGSWLGAVESHDDRTGAVVELMDKVMVECEELDCLLTLYNVELGTLTEDVAYIEAQSQGLQVQTANQKVLHSELKSLLDTISISSSQLRILHEASLKRPRDLQEAESTLAQLYSAMMTIDPKQAGGRPMSGDPNLLRKNSASGAAELSSMLAVREKRVAYRRESSDFIQRLKQCLVDKFRDAEAETQDALMSSRNSRFANPTKLNDALRDKPKRDLWMYSPLLLFTREVERTDWEELLKAYCSKTRIPYEEEFRHNTIAWRENTRKPFGDEQDVLFTAQEKENDGIVGRKLTVRRPKVTRPDGSSRISSGGGRDGKVTAYESFAAILAEQVRIILIEQNCLVELFHMSSLETRDFMDTISVAPESRRAHDLLIKRPFDPDRGMAGKVVTAMEQVFAAWPEDLRALAEWAMKQDSLNAVGILYAIEMQRSELEDTNQEFISQTTGKVHEKVLKHFNHFIDEQTRAIDETKVKTNKRKGVIAFIKTFPNFSAALESMLLPSSSLDILEIRATVDDAYQRINKSMFESLKFIAKESPSTALGHSTVIQGGGHDPEDKEALNHHILMIENMNHYLIEVEVKTNRVLQGWHDTALTEMREHLNLYVSAVIRRPLGKILEFVESAENKVNSNAAGSLAQKPSHARPVFKKLLGSYDTKEIRRGIDALKKRVEKHFGEADTDSLSKDLVSKVCNECQDRYLLLRERLERLIQGEYSGELEIEFRREEVLGAFRR